LPNVVARVTVLRTNHHNQKKQSCLHLTFPNPNAMGTNQDLTATHRGAIAYGHNQGQSIRTIAKNLGCSKSAVGVVVKRLKETGTVEPQTKRPGRPPLLSTPNRSELKQIITHQDEHNRRLNKNQITSLFTARSGIEVSASTIQRNIKLIGLRSCMAREKPSVNRITFVHFLSHRKAPILTL
jgi:transposase